MAVRHGIPGRLARHLTVLTLGATVLAGSAMTTVRAEETRVSANVLKTPVRSIPGPKRTVAVSRFASKSDFNLHYGLTDVGGGLSAMLTAALVESGQFLVVERETLSDVLAEQSLIASGLVKEEGAAIPGALLGASLLVKGAVTEFSEAAGGGGFGIGLAGVGVGIKSRVAMVGLDIQIIDATTSQVLASYKVLEKASGKAVGVDLARAGIDTGFTKFFETPIGQAAHKAITAAVERFALEAASRPWTGHVVAFDSGEVVINAGQTSGLKVGDTFAVERASAAFTDPATGRVLGRRKTRLGRLVITAVEDEMAFATYQAVADAVPMRGDLVVVQQ
jgi:curli biogenesis system outer membrane secretion channel CsgG